MTIFHDCNSDISSRKVFLWHSESTVVIQTPLLLQIVATHKQWLPKSQLALVTDIT
jgi:hypothetical protein